MKCVILETEKGGKVKIISFDKTQDIEEILTDNYEYDLGAIQYQCYEDLKIEID